MEAASDGNIYEDICMCGSVYICIHEASDVFKLKAAVLLFASNCLLNARPPLRDLRNVDVVDVGDLCFRPNPLE